MIIAPIDRLEDPLGVLRFSHIDQNALLTLKRFGELYKQFTIMNREGINYIFCKYLYKTSSYPNRHKPRLMANGRDMDDRYDFKNAYVTDKDLKRIQRYLNWKAFFSRIRSERRLYKLLAEKNSFVLHALHTFVHSWLAELPDDTRGKTSDHAAIYDTDDQAEIMRKLYRLEEERMDRIATIRVLPTTTDPRMM